MFSTGPNKDAYLGKHAQDFLMKSSAQVERVYEKRGLNIPVVTSSTFHIIAEQKEISLSEISSLLQLPHQLIAQRTDKLSKLGLIKKRPDPNDGRRSNYTLTRKGRDQAAILIKCMSDISKVYKDIFNEIECDLSAALINAISLLEEQSIASRLDKLCENKGTGV